MNRTRTIKLANFATLFTLCSLAIAWMWPGTGASQGAPANDEPLPTHVVIDVNAPERALYRIAVPELLGSTSSDGCAVLRNDLKLSSLFEVLDPRSFIANAQQEGLGITKAPWSSVGAQGVVKGELKQSGGSVALEMRLFELAKGEAPSLSKSYRGSSSQLRGFMHDFGNEILRVLTGKKGSFGTRLLFARKMGVGRKDIMSSDFDGYHEFRVSSGRGNAMLPSFGAVGGAWYSMLTELGGFITNTKSRERAVINSNGINMGPTVCNGRVYFSSTRDGNSEIYSAALDGSDQRRLTNSPGIDVSPACGPGGRIAFVSTRHGGPQIFAMDGNGGSVSRITYKGAHNQTPAWCMDPDSPLLAFSARDGGGFDIVTVNLKTGEYKRLTQGQGVNQDPAFSPDCRMVAFASSRGGIFISNPEGLNQTKVVSGSLSTVRWSR